MLTDGFAPAARLPRFHVWFRDARRRLIPPALRSGLSGMTLLLSRGCKRSVFRIRTKMKGVRFLSPARFRCRTRRLAAVCADI
jgi:hypothetical protein